MKSSQSAAARLRLRQRTLHCLAAAAFTCGMAGSLAAQPMTADKSAAPKSSVRPAAESQPEAKRSKWQELFTADELDAWQQKIAGATDEAERRRIRGQRLGEIQRRTKAKQAEAGMPASASAAPRPR